jgi:general secretion pathway protein B
MSYILDALRRADAERRRGQAPALQQVAAPPAAAPGPDGRPAARAWLALAALALLALAAAGWWFGRSQPMPTPSLASAPPSPAAAPPSKPVVVAPPTPSASMPVAPMQALPAAAVRAPKVPAEARNAKPPPAAAAASSPAPRPIAASELPEPQRSAVAQLAFGGAVQSQDRSQSFVLLAGQIVREGDTLAPGIVLERIGARTLLLRVDSQLVERPL